MWQFTCSRFKGTCSICQAAGAGAGPEVRASAGAAPRARRAAARVAALRGLQRLAQCRRTHRATAQTAHHRQFRQDVSYHLTRFTPSEHYVFKRFRF